MLAVTVHLHCMVVVIAAPPPTQIYGGDLAQWEKQFLDSPQPSQSAEN